MTVDPLKSVSPDRATEMLESWKEIASYLGRSVRAVQMWERDEGPFTGIVTTSRELSSPIGRSSTSGCKAGV